MSGDEVLAFGLLVVGGFLGGGVYACWGRSRAVAGVLAVLAVLAVVGGVLRLVPTGA